MSRLTRVHQKVFASNAANNGVFGSLQAGNPQTSNDVATLQSLSAFENGWDDAIEQGDKLPPLEEFQGIQYGISYQQAYMLQEGIAEWDSSTPYYKGSLAKTISGSSFKLYCSLSDNNTGNIVTNTTYWKLVMDSDAGYFILNSNNTASGNNTWTGVNTFSGSITSSANNTFTGKNTFTKSIYVKNTGNRVVESFGSDNNVCGTFESWDDGNSNKTAIYVFDESGTNSAMFGVNYNNGNPEASASSGVKKSIVGWAMPNYNSGVSKSSGTNYTATSNGFLYVEIHRSSGNSGTLDLKIGNTTFNIHSQDYDWNACLFPIAKGVTYSLTLSGVALEKAYFYPCYGG